MIELLAPAGSYEQLTAAVRCGADAVYMGTKNFNARRNADNFDGITLSEAVSFCHARNTKVYITLNTLIKDSEINDFLNTVEEVADSGADAVIIQDLAVYNLIKKCIPDMPLHASTQMAINNSEGAKLLESLGFTRIVAARELSLKEIEAICSSVGCEIEVFVHGAHCMSASGLCYMSSALGTRSGNRGLCAQPCRLNFTENDRQFALSLKDMCLIDDLHGLKKAGVTSLKIEGRMKRPEYVAAAVSQYRSALENGDYDIRELKNIFSRSGFTDGYLKAERNLDMFGYRTKEDVINMTSALKSIKNKYSSDKPAVPVDFSLTVLKDRKALLTATDGINTVSSEGDIPERALNVSLTDEKAEKYLFKTGGTIFFPRRATYRIEDGLTLSAGVLNEMRRDCLGKLFEERNKDVPKHFIKYNSEFNEHKISKPEIRCFFSDAGQIFDGGYDRIILPLDRINDDILNKYKDILICALPVLIYEARINSVKERLLCLKRSGLKYALAENPGAVKLIRDCGIECLGGPRLNILNSVAADEYRKLGLNDAVLSPEMSFNDIKKMRTSLLFGISVYGHMPLMHFRCCPMQSRNGCGNCNGKQKLTDRTGKEFTVLCNERQFSVLHNCIPLYVKQNELPHADFYMLYFTTESSEKCKKILSDFIQNKAIDEPRTLGLYNKKLQ